MRLSVAVSFLSLSLATWASVGPSVACDRTIVDLVWTGTRTKFGSVATDRYAFIAYFDADRRLTVARIDLETCVVIRKRLASVFRGWDSHNYTAIALDDQLRLHVAGNMHAGSLTYFRGTEALDVQSLQPAAMTGQEARVTYPSFFRRDAGLFFLYRQGVAANGVWYMNEWSGREWHRVKEAPVFDADLDGVVASAYPSEFELGPDGFFHVAVVWRGDPGVENDFRVSYAKTQDFRAWLGHDGEPLPTPLGPDTMEIVDDVGRHGGLVNNAKVDIDGAGQPYVLYTKYTERGRNGAYLARPARGQWRTTLLAESSGSTSVEGRGPSGRLPRISKNNSAGVAVAVVRFAGEPAIKVQLSDFGIASDLSSAAPAKIGRDSIFELVGPRLADPNFMSSRTRTSDGRAFADVYFTWVTQGPNRDRPRKCTAEARAACQPPASPLLLSQIP